jgi:hypothetical protein
MSDVCKLCDGEGFTYEPEYYADGTLSRTVTQVPCSCSVVAVDGEREAFEAWFGRQIYSSVQDAEKAERVQWMTWQAAKASNSEDVATVYRFAAVYNDKICFHETLQDAQRKPCERLIGIYEIKDDNYADRVVSAAKASYGVPNQTDKARIEELETICAEAYQVVGLLSDFLPDAKLLDNLSQQKLVHTDVLPCGVSSGVPMGEDELARGVNAINYYFERFQEDVGWGDDPKYDREALRQALLAVANITKKESK